MCVSCILCVSLNCIDWSSESCLYRYHSRHKGFKKGNKVYMIIVFLKLKGRRKSLFGDRGNFWIRNYSSSTKIKYILNTKQRNKQNKNSYTYFFSSYFVLKHWFFNNVQYIIQYKQGIIVNPSWSSSRDVHMCVCMYAIFFEGSH